MPRNRKNGAADLITVAGAARYTGRNKKFIEERLAEGELKNLGTEKRPKFDKESLEQFKTEEKRQGVRRQAPPRPASSPGVPTVHWAVEGEEEEEERPLFPMMAATRRRGEVRSSTNLLDGEEPAPNPEDIYEKWRLDPDVWKPGQTCLFVRAREIDSNEFIPMNPNYWGEMLPYEDLQAKFPGGVMLEITIKGAKNAKGIRKTIKGPLRLRIGPQGEYQMSGFGSPFSTGRVNGATTDSKFWLQHIDNLHKQSRADNTQSTNTWMSLLSSPAFQKKDESAGMMPMFMFMMQLQQEAAKQQAAQQQQQQQMQQQANQNFMLMMMQMISTMGNNNNNPEMFSAIIEAIKSQGNAATEQNKILLQSALTKDDLGKQLELFGKFKELTDDGPAGEIAKVIDAAGLGNAINTLATAGATRLEAGANKETTPAPINVPPPAGQQAIPEQAAPPNPYAPQQPPGQPLPQAPMAPDQQVADAQAKFQQLLATLGNGFKGGQDPKAIANSFFESNKEHKAALVGYHPDQLLPLVAQYGPMMGFAELAQTDGQDFIREFIEEVRRLASE